MQMFAYMTFNIVTLALQGINLCYTLKEHNLI